MAESLTTCNGCGMRRLCREHEGLWLCIGGPSRCFKHQKRVELDKQRASAREGADD